MPDFADDTRTELERKAASLKVVAFVESITYTLAFLFWIPFYNPVAKALMFFFHGLVSAAFAAMVVLIYRDMRWPWWFAALGIVLGPVGAIIVYERIRRDGVPLDRRGSASVA